MKFAWLKNASFLNHYFLKELFDEQVFTKYYESSSRNDTHYGITDNDASFFLNGIYMAN